MTPALSFLISFARAVLLYLRCTCHVSAFGFVDPIRLSGTLKRCRMLLFSLPILTRLQLPAGGKPFQTKWTVKSHQTVFILLLILTSRSLPTASEKTNKTHMEKVSRP